jgi:signal transduction histidine kinase
MDATESRAWPILAALLGVALLVLGMLVVDVWVANRVARRTSEIVRDSALDSSPDERVELQRLKDSLFRGQITEVSGSLDRLVAMNRVEARAQAEAIRRIHEQAIWVDLGVGLMTVMLVSLIAFILVRVVQRQRALQARQLALVEERNRELDAFAGRAAHDLRGPLNPIRGYADLLMAAPGSEPPEEIREMASRIRIAVDRMARVVDDMLELSRAGRPPPGEASPSDVGAEVIEELQPDLRGAEITTALTDAKVACAPGVLAQILRNLVGNAVKFRSRQRKLAVQLEARVTDGVVEIECRDNGVGMDEEAAAHAFEPYFRGRTDREVPGHGLGLAIVERATRALGGSCELFSQPDGGTRILVRLPKV